MPPDDPETLCRDCGEPAADWFAPPDDPSARLCASCFDEAYTSCDHCGETIAQDDAFYHDDHAYCDACFSARFTTCNLCDETVRRSDCFNGRCRDCGGRERSHPSRILRGARFDRMPFKRLAGIEYEYVAPRDEGEPVTLQTLGDFHEDGSVCGRDDEQGCEFAAFPASGDQLIRSIKRICGELSGCRVNKSCGLHVHVDMQDLAPNQRGNVAAWWVLLEPLMLAQVSPSRRNGTNTYCNPWGGSIPDTDDDDSRYWTLNLSAFDKHGTYEFRLHQGSLNPQKVAAWAYLCLSFVESYKDVPVTADIVARWRTMSDRGKVTLFLQTCAMPMRIKKHVVRRMRAFAALDRASGRTPVLNLERAA